MNEELHNTPPEPPEADATVDHRAGTRFVALARNPEALDRMTAADAGEARWTAIRRQALADGILDAAVGTRYETFLRPQALRWSEWAKGQMGKVRRGLDVLEKEDLGDTVDIGTISVACALGYLDFRYADEGWRDARPTLAACYETFAARPSMTETAPG